MKNLSKKLILGMALLLVIVGFYACPRQKLLAARFSDADRVILTNHIHKVSSTFVGADAQKIVHSLRTLKRVVPWQKVDSTGGYRFEFFRGTNRLGRLKAGWGVFWIGGTTYIDRDSSLDALYERLRNENIQAYENPGYLRQ